MLTADIEGLPHKVHMVAVGSRSNAFGLPLDSSTTSLRERSSSSMLSSGRTGEPSAPTASAMCVCPGTGKVLVAGLWADPAAGPMRGSVLRVWDASTGRQWGEPLDQLRPWRDMTCLALCVSPEDGRVFVAAGGEYGVFVWDVGSGQCVNQGMGRGERVSGVAIHFCEHPSAELLEVTRTRRRSPVADQSFPLHMPVPVEGRLLVAIVEQHRDGLSDSESELSVWDVASNSPVQYHLSVGHAFWSHDGPGSATPRSATSSLVWGVTRAIPSLVSLTTTSDGRILVASVWNNSEVLVLDVMSHRPVCGPLRGTSGTSSCITSVSIGAHPDGKVLVACSFEDHSVHVWDTNSGGKESHSDTSLLGRGSPNSLSQADIATPTSLKTFAKDDVIDPVKDSILCVSLGASVREELPQVAVMSPSAMTMFFFTIDRWTTCLPCESRRGKMMLMLRWDCFVLVWM